MSSDHSPYVPTTVPALVDRLKANMERWKGLHAAAEERAASEAAKRAEAHKEGRTEA